MATMCFERAGDTFRKCGILIRELRTADFHSIHLLKQRVIALYKGIRKIETRR